MSRLSPLAELECILDQQLSQAKQLRNVLEREWTAVSNREFDELDVCCAKKTTLSNELDSLECQRRTISSHLQRENQSLQSALSKTDSLQKKWLELKNVLTEIKDRNIHNGILINQCAVHNKQSLTVMFGKGEAKDSTYHSSGAYSEAPTTGSIGRA